jgi:hypothetical protein
MAPQRILRVKPLAVMPYFASRAATAKMIGAVCLVISRISIAQTGGYHEITYRGTDSLLSDIRHPNLCSAVLGLFSGERGETMPPD